MAPPPPALPAIAFPTTSMGNTPYSDVTGLKTVKKDGKVIIRSAECFGWVKVNLIRNFTHLNQPVYVKSAISPSRFL